MPIMLRRLDEALRDAGAAPDKAAAAAEEVAGFETRLGAVETKLSVLQWMVGTNIAITLAVLFKVL